LKITQNIDHFSSLEESGLFYVQSICSQLLIDLLTVVSYLSYQHFEEEAQQAINQRKIQISAYALGRHGFEPNRQQLVVCIRWIDDGLQAHEDFIGLYKIDNTKASTIAESIKDVVVGFTTT
jgi:hypothetical protein